jgi:uncharacterized protein YidB (DUF937 family)
MKQKSTKKRKPSVSTPYVSTAKLASANEIESAAKFLDDMSRRGYGDATSLNISAEQKQKVSQRAMSNALGK